MSNHLRLVDHNDLVTIREAADSIAKSQSWVRDRTVSGALSVVKSEAGRRMVSLGEVAAMHRAHLIVKAAGRGKRRSKSKHLWLVVDNT